MISRAGLLAYGSSRPSALPSLRQWVTTSLAIRPGRQTETPQTQWRDRSGISPDSLLTTNSMADTKHYYVTYILPSLIPLCQGFVQDRPHQTSISRRSSILHPRTLANLRTVPACPLLISFCPCSYICMDRRETPLASESSRWEHPYA